MKGILFGGCSFTWGQGLYYYSNLNRLPILENDYTYHPELIKESHLRFKDSIRYPRLVANNFNTFEVFKDNNNKDLGNGGSEDDTFDFFDNIFENKRFFYDDFDYIIIQLSNVYRNKFYYTHNNLINSVILNPKYSHFQNDTNNIKEYYINSSITFEDIMKDHLLQQYTRLRKKMLYYEEQGIKTRILSWQDDLLDLIFSDEFTNDRFIKMEYNNTTVNTIEDLMRLDNNKFTIECDKFFTEKILDNHPSKYCHKIIADSIIKNIK
jgi:hypothetical protein